MSKTYIVTAYKYGSRNNHSYVVGVYNDKYLAVDSAEEEEDNNNGKYVCEVLCFNKTNSRIYKTIRPIRHYGNL